MTDPQKSLLGFSDTLSDLVAKFNPSCIVLWIATISQKNNLTFLTTWHQIVENRSKDLENIYGILTPRDNTNEESGIYFVLLIPEFLNT